MNKKRLNTLVALYFLGVRRETCFMAIVDLCKRNNASPASWIEQFMNTIRQQAFVKSTRKEK